MKILIDADACPRAVLQICFKLAHEFNLQLWTVASFNHNIESDHHIVVGNASQEADLKIMNLTESQDIVITQDWGLAAMILGKGARCLNPIGREYLPETMDFLLEEREIKAKLRRGGGRTKGPKKRNREDDKHFEHCLRSCLER
jgi:uncharacterized protein YaiI (UPF0178 family)